MVCKHCGTEEQVKHKQREEAERKDLITRLNRIEGQVRGVKAMVEEDRYCVDISNQLMATQSILGKTNNIVLQAHVACCVREAMESGDTDEKLQEISALLNKLVK